MTGDGYTTVVNYLLIVCDSGEWFLDGRNANGDFTEACWSYDTWAEAMADVPEFARALTEDYGLTVEWRTR